MAAPQRGLSHQDGVSPSRAEPEEHFASRRKGAGVTRPVLSGATREEGRRPFSPARADLSALLAGDPPAQGRTESRGWSPPYREADFRLQITFN